MKAYLRTQYGKILHCVDGLFRANYYYICTPTHDEFVKIAKHQWDIDVEDNTEAEGECLFLTTDHGTMCVIWTCRKDPMLIAHEVFHAIVQLLRGQSIPLTEETEEVYALCQMYVMGAILSKDKDNGKEEKRRNKRSAKRTAKGA